MSASPNVFCAYSNRLVSTVEDRINKLESFVKQVTIKQIDLKTTERYLPQRLLPTENIIQFVKINNLLDHYRIVVTFEVEQFLFMLVIRQKYDNPDVYFDWSIACPNSLMTNVTIDQTKDERIFSKRKNHAEADLLIQLIKTVCQIFPPTHMGVYGDGEFIQLPEPPAVYSGKFRGVNPINYFSKSHLAFLGATYEALEATSPYVLEDLGEGYLYVSSIEDLIGAWSDTEHRLEGISKTLFTAPA